MFFGCDNIFSFIIWGIHLKWVQQRLNHFRLIWLLQGAICGFCDATRNCRLRKRSNAGRSLQAWPGRGNLGTALRIKPAWENQRLLNFRSLKNFGKWPDDWQMPTFNFVFGRYSWLIIEQKCGTEVWHRIVEGDFSLTTNPHVGGFDEHSTERLFTAMIGFNLMLRLTEDFELKGTSI